MRRFIVILSLTLTVALAMRATQRWEEVDAPPVALIELQDSDEETAVITVKEGYIYVTSEEKVTVKVFTILGQLISQETLPGGTHRFLMKAKGIYILKIGDRTHRVAI